MNTPLQYKVFDKQQIVYEDELSGPVQLGRQNDARVGDSEEVFRPRRLDANRWRLAIARYDENNVSREHALIEPITEDRVRITNLSTKLPITIQLPVETLLQRWDQKSSEAPPSQELTIPCMFHLGHQNNPKTIRVQEAHDATPGILQSLSEVSRPPGRYRDVVNEQLRKLREPTAAVAEGVERADPEAMVRWLQSTLGVLQDAASASDFFRKAAVALVDNVMLDSGWVMLWDHDRQQWIERARHCHSESEGELERRPSVKFLNQIRELKRTSWKTPEQSGTDSARSLIRGAVSAAVAAPLIDTAGEVIGALYGDRRDNASGPATFTKLEALLVELLAGSVAAGLARLTKEEQVKKAENQLEFILGKDLAAEVTRNPDLVTPRESEITVLFADIRNFSAISRALGHKPTFEWINEVMQRLSECVLRHEGLVVDYIGDALMAMWGAPKPDKDHALHACRAALDMLAIVPEINDAWSQLPQKMGLGIGINTGMAETGNTGSRVRFKYGPLGNTVNLASRVEGTTKYLKCSLIVTEMTRQMIGEEIPSRKLCTVRVVGIKDPVDLYELVDPTRFQGTDPENPGGDWHDLQTRYEAALAAFEDEKFNLAARTLGNLLADFPQEGPSLVLLKRAVNGLIEGRDEDHPIFQLTSK